MNILEHFDYNCIPEEEQKSLTVCITVYNIEDYLTRAIEAVLNSSYKNIEILLIDDGSTDSSGDICDRYSEKDSRVKVIHKTNGGVSSARNLGIEEANGYYFTYLDGDDYPDKDMYMALICALEQQNADMAICRYRQVIGTKVIEDHSTNKAYLYDGLELLEYFLQENDLYQIQNAPWNKVYKKSLIGDIRFPEGIYEDALYTPMLLAKVDKSIYLDYAYYNYSRDRETSIMHKSVINPYIFTYLIPNYIKRSEFISTLGCDELKALSDYFLYKRLLIFITELYRSDYSDKKNCIKLIDNYIHEFQPNFDYVYSSKYANPNEYKKMKIYLKSPLLYRITIYINEKIIIPIKTGRSK